MHNDSASSSCMARIGALLNLLEPQTQQKPFWKHLDHWNPHFAQRPNIVLSGLHPFSSENQKRDYTGLTVSGILQLALRCPAFTPGPPCNLDRTPLVAQWHAITHRIVIVCHYVANRQNSWRPENSYPKTFPWVWAPAKKKKIPDGEESCHAISRCTPETSSLYIPF